MTRQLLLFIAILLFNELGGAIIPPSKRQIYKQLAGELQPDSRPDTNQLAAFRKEITPSKFKIAGAKRLTLRYKALELPKQANRSITLKDITSMSVANIWTTATKLIQDFPSDATILNLGLHLVDENDKALSASDGVYQSTLTVKDGGVKAAWNCDRKPLIATTEHVLAEYGRGPEAFTPIDGSDASVGFWAKPKSSDLYELSVSAVNLDPNRGKTVVAKFEVDFVNGRPKKNTGRQDFPLSVCEDEKIVKDPAGGTKAYVSRPTRPMLFTLPGEVVAMQPFMPAGVAKMNIKINGKLVCTSKANYQPASRSSQPGNDASTVQLTGMTPCNNSIKVAAGDKFDTETFYDFGAHPIPQHVENRITSTGLYPYVPSGDSPNYVDITFAQ